MLMWVMSDRAIPRSFRMMEGFGVHTFRFVNAEGESTFVKFHWKPARNAVGDLGRGAEDQRRRSRLPSPRPVVGDPVRRLPRMGARRPGLRRRCSPTSFAFDILDATKLIPEEVVPVERIGRMVLDRNVDNFFAETEQVAFCTQNIVPGDRLHERPAAAGPELLVSRHAAQAAGLAELHPHPRQRTECPVAHFQQDGHMAMTNPRAARTTNRIPGGRGGRERIPRVGFTTFPTPTRGRQASRPAGAVRRPLQPGPACSTVPRRRSSRTHIADAHRLRTVEGGHLAIRHRVVASLRNVDEDLAQHVADGLGFDELPDRLEPASRPASTWRVAGAEHPCESARVVRGRKLGVLVSARRRRQDAEDAAQGRRRRGNDVARWFAPTP